MKTIIRITKQEAIDAWKAQNSYQNDKEIIVEIEENNIHYTGIPFQTGLTPLTSIQPGNRCTKCGGVYYTSYHVC